MANSKKPQSSTPQTKTAPLAPSKPAALPFPGKELDTWLKGHQDWNHDEWMALLADLKKKGFGAFTDSKEGQDSIGLYIETHRSKSK